MKRLNFFGLMCFFGVFAACAFAQSKDPKKYEISVPKNYQPIKLVSAADMQTLLSGVIAETIREYAAKGLKENEIAVTVIDMRNAQKITTASYRGDEKIYPASVVKFFYAVALLRQIEDGKVKWTKELERGLRDMIVDSSNEATQYILDVLTETSSGAEMAEAPFKEWSFKRNRVNRFYSSLGYQNINVNQKTFCEDAYGIEQQFRGYKGENRNKLNTNATARLFAEFWNGKLISAENTEKLMTLLARDPYAPTKEPDDQAHGFTGKYFTDSKINGVKIWSKAGWTSSTRHDAAYVETPDGQKFVIVIFTENHAADSSIIPAIVGKILRGLK